MTTKKTNRSKSFDVYFQQKLKDPKYIKEYINSTLESLEKASPEEVQASLIGCLRDIIEAHGGVNQFAKKIPEIHRTTLYGILDEKRRNGPEFLTVLKIMEKCGLSLKVA